MDEKMRAEFEEWITSPPLEKPVHRNPESSGFPGQYRAYEVQLAWESWQASRAALDVVSLSDFEALKSEHNALKHAVGRLMDNDFAEDCEECGIGLSDAWAEVKTMIAGAGVRVKP